MAGANVLSDEALAQVRDVVRQVMGQLRGSQPLPRPPIAQGPEIFIVKAESAIPARDEDEPGLLADVPLYRIDRNGPTLEQLFLNDGTTANARDVYNVTETEIAEGDYAIVWRDKLGSWLTVPIASNIQIRRGCLAEAHPGCGVVFGLKLGTHNPATDEWDYEATASAKGIDHWYSVAGPYPPAGATGWFRAYPSDTYGTLWHGWDISCDDDACGTCEEPA